MDVGAMEARIAREPYVRECAVRVRDRNGRSAIVVYLVPKASLSSEQAAQRIQALLSQSLGPIDVVLLSCLPVTPEGELDEQRLGEFPILDTDTIEQLESHLGCIPGVSKAAVLKRVLPREVRRLHLDDLLPPAEPARHLLRPADSCEEPRRRVPALSEGGPIEDPLHRTATLLTYLAAAARAEGGREVIYLDSEGGETRQSYRDLAEAAERVLFSLRRLGIRPGDKVLLQLPDNRDFVTTLWACLLGGIVAVPISVAASHAERNGAVNKLSNAWRFFDGPPIVTTEALAPQIRPAHRLYDDPPYRVVSIENLSVGQRDRDWHNAEPDDVCLMLLTSGSTGVPKAVMLTHRNVVCRSLGMAQRNGFSGAGRLFNWFPMDHVGAVVMYHALAVTLNATQVLAPTEYILQDPLRWLDVIDHYRITDTWAPNFAFGLVNERMRETKDRNWYLTSLQTILNGGEAIVAETAKQFLELLKPHGLAAGAMLPAWGMSETSSGVTCCRFIESSSGEGANFTCVGAPIPGVSIRIADDHGAVAREKHIGRVQIRGLSVTPGYYKNQELNATSFSDGWFETGDLGFLDAGRLTITGRAKDVIIINGVNFYCHEIESVAESVPGVEVSFTAACPVREAGAQSDRLAIFFCASSVAAADRIDTVRRIRDVVTRQAGVKPDYIVPVERDKIPKTAIGKIERSRLRARLEAGSFDGTIKQIERELESPNTIPAWFFQKRWLRKQARVVEKELPTGRYLVFADEHGLGDSVCYALRRAGRPVTCVRAGRGFARPAENSYVLNPRCSEEYRRLFESLGDGHQQRIENVVHLWDFTEAHDAAQTVEDVRQAQIRGVYSVLSIVQLLTSWQGEEHPLRILVAANRSQAAAGNDVVDPEKATVFGLLRTIPLELPWMDCRHVDLDDESPAEHLLAELRVSRAPMEIAYRAGKRHVSSLSSLDMASPGAPPIERGGVYLVTGALGGIGCEVSKWLAREFGARLALVGRSELPPPAQWGDVLLRGGPAARRLRSYQAIESCGDVFYQGADVTDYESLNRGAAEAESRWSRPLDGVFHLAGVGNLLEHWDKVAERRVSDIAVETFEWMFAPKVYGTFQLLRLVQQRRQAIFVGFSSVNSLFGGATFGAYSAANGYLDAQAHGPLQRRSFCINWAMWGDLGMTSGSPAHTRENTRQMGYHVLSPQQGLASLGAALARGNGQVIVGLDIENPHIRSRVEEDAYALEGLTVYAEPADGVSQSEVAERIRDRCSKFGRCEVQTLDRLPLESNGAVDRRTLTAAENAERTRGEDPPRTPTERAVARIWQELLGLPQVRRQDSFLDVGGDSLTGARLLNRIRQEFGVQLSVRAIFEQPTIVNLAGAIEALRPLSPKTAKPAVSETAIRIEELSQEQIEELIRELTADRTLP